MFIAHLKAHRLVLFLINRNIETLGVTFISLIMCGLKNKQRYTCNVVLGKLGTNC